MVALFYERSVIPARAAERVTGIQNNCCELTCTLPRYEVARRPRRAYDASEKILKMPLPPSTQEVEKMVRTKLRHQHPSLYRELLASGQLDEVAKAIGAG